MKLNETLAGLKKMLTATKPISLNPMGKLIPSVLALSFCWVTLSFGGTIKIPQDFQAISAALNAAKSGDTILISDGTYTEHDIVINKSVTIRSEFGATNCTVNVNRAGRGFIVDKAPSPGVVILGLTIQNAQIPYYNGGGALLVLNGKCRLSKCIIQGTSGAADYSGGPVSSQTTNVNDLLVDNCIVRNNFAANGCGVGNAVVNNCWIYANSAGNNPMALAECKATNCTVYGNTGGFLPNPWTAGGMSGGIAVNCIIWGNSGNNGQQINRTGPAIVNYCIVQSGWEGTGNLSSDPMFVNAATGDFRTQVGSPALGHGDPAILGISDIGGFPDLTMPPLGPLVPTQDTDPETFVWTKLLSSANMPSLNAETGWRSLPGSIDQNHRIIYSFSETGVFWKYDIAKNSFTQLPVSGWPGRVDTFIYNPDEDTVWLTLYGRGQVFRLPVTGGAITSVGSSGASYADFGNITFWNPVTHKFSTFNGYGFMAVRNWRWEFGSSDSDWVQLEPNMPGRQPWPRSGGSWTVDNIGQRVFHGGGEGNSSGQQGQVDAGFDYFCGDTRFDALRDLWLLDLKSNSWVNLIPLNTAIRHFGPIVYLPPSNMLLMINGQNTTSSGAFATGVWTFKIGQDTNFNEANISGDIPKASDDPGGLAFPYYDPLSERVVYFNNEGVYALSAQRSHIPRQTIAVAEVINGFVVGVTITDPGYGYSNVPIVEIVGGGGTGATATASISNGVVTAITVTGAGKGYTSAPIVRIASPFIAPAIAAQPQSLAVPVGELAAFQVAATGTAPLHYQWLKNGSAIAAATAASYSIASVQFADSGDYSVLVTNIAGSVVSQVAQLTVNVPPSITSQPLNLSVTAGGLVTFQVAATGTAPLDYQWLKNGDAVAGATATVFTISEAQAADAGNYSVRVANIAGSVVSLAAQLTVNIPPSITSQPGSLTVPNGGLAAFQVAATGTPPLSYQWYVNGTAIPAATKASLTIANTYYEHAGNYTVVVSSPFGSQTSQIAVLVVKVVPNFVLKDLTPGGGFVMPEPFQSSFAPNSFVTLTAMPADGWTFLDWKGNTQGANPVVTLQVTSDKTVRARFGTQITVKPSGSGAVSADPASELYPYGASVRIVAQPQPGNWFTGWSGSASGDANPLTMVIQDANPVVVASFAALPSGYAALTLIPDGYGEVSVLPVANTFTNGQVVALNALPNKGQEFLGWSGDAAGSSPSLEVAMSQSKVIRASFTKRPHLDIQPLDVDGVLLTLAGEFSGTYSLLASTNLINWAPHLTLTNSYGEAQIMDPLTADQSLFYRAAAPGQARRTATAIPTLVNGFLVAITITDGGAGYTIPPAVAITGGGGNGATATATVLNGVVEKILVANAGNGYTGTPAVFIAAP